MSIKKISLWIAIILIGIVVVNQIVHLVWDGISAYKLRNSKQKQQPSVKRALLWRNPGSITKMDFTQGPGGSRTAPKPPFKFLKENMGGSSPSVFVKDSRAREWRVKWGEEVRSETFANRLVWATGYFSDVDYFVPQGRILETKNLQRADGWIDTNQNFKDARFELDDPQVEKWFDEQSWAWNDNPFLGTRELAGLKILVMLTSNWDNKDKRDVSRGSNTALFFYPIDLKTTEGRYLISDWGASMGKWGANILNRRKWDAQGYQDQTPDFIQGIQDGTVLWGYAGQRTEDVTIGITVADVHWFYQHIRNLTDAQLLDGLRSCGASEHEISLFVPAIRDRINQLRQVAEGNTKPTSAFTAIAVSP